MVSQPNHLLQDSTTMSLINKMFLVVGKEMVTEDCTVLQLMQSNARIGIWWAFAESQNDFPFVPPQSLPSPLYTTPTSSLGSSIGLSGIAAIYIQKLTCHANMVLENVNDLISSRLLSLLVLSNCFVLKIIQKYLLFRINLNSILFFVYLLLIN